MAVFCQFLQQPPFQTVLSDFILCYPPPCFFESSQFPFSRRCPIGVLFLVGLIVACWGHRHLRHLILCVSDIIVDKKTKKQKKQQQQQTNKQTNKQKPKKTKKTTKKQNKQQQQTKTNKKQQQNKNLSMRCLIYRDYYQSVFGYRQYHVLGIQIVLCEPLACIIHYFFIPNTRYCRYPKTRG